MQQAVQYLGAILAYVAGVGAFGVVAVRIVAPRSAAGRLAARVVDARVPVSAAIGVTAMLGSLYFSEVAEMVPCRLCWFQRVAMYPIGIIGLVAALRRDRGAHWYLGAFAAIGLAVSSYHNLLEFRPDLDTGSCAVFGPACSVVWFRTLGLSLATMAWLGFAAVLVLNTVNFPSRSDDLHE